MHSFQKALQTSKPANCIVDERFARFVELLLTRSGNEAQRLGPEAHSIHQHFGLTSSTLDILDANFLENQTVSFKSSYYDTPDFDLAHRNLWLVHQDGWTLKSCAPASDENLVGFHGERYREAIEGMLAKKLNLPSVKLETLFTTPYAKMDITRRVYISSTGCSLYVDAARLAPADYYLVGTVCLAVEGTPSLDLLEALTPARSIVVEYLYHDLRSLYDELVEKKVLPHLRTHYSETLTHRAFNPFHRPKERFEGEEVQLLRSINVKPDEKEAIEIFRNGAAEAKMEWLPFLRMVSDLFLQGAEQGVYAPITTVDP